MICFHAENNTLFIQECVTSVSNGFELALAIYFLNPETIQYLWNQSESEPEPEPESNFESIIVLNYLWLKHFEINEPCRSRFWVSKNRREISFKGVMLEVEKYALLDTLSFATYEPLSEHLEAIERIYIQSRRIHKETTL